MLTAPWRIEMFGGLRAQQGGQRVERFRRGKEAGLLAFLAFHLARSHAREQLVDRFWPEADADAGRASLRVALTSLRRRLEPPGTPQGSVLVADRTTVRLSTASFVTDVSEFEAGIGATWQNPGVRVGHLEQTVALYHGELLPGHLDDWARDERERLAQMFLGALKALSRALDEQGEADRAIDYAARAVAADPLDEEACLVLLRLYAGAGRGHDGLRLFEKFRRRLSDELGWEPSPEARQLAQELRADPRNFLKARTERPPSASAAPTGRPEAPAPGGTSLRPPSRLPSPTTRFFGREEEVRGLLTAFIDQGRRLVTLSGPAGIGKTRLAVEAAWRLVGSPAGQQKADPEEAGRAWFVPLADVQDAGLIPQAVLAALGGPGAASEDPLERIVKELSGPPGLLVLDNFEQIAGEGAAVVHALLERTPGLCCLVTSRRHLGLIGESVRDVRPLPLPEPTDALECLAEQASVRLFVDRAQARAPEFQITAANRSAVVTLVCGLEGIPLALEMAATWARTITPARMASGLKDRYKLLDRNLKGVPDRHRTLQNAVAWSYGLLSPEAGHLLAQLSAFRGGWTSEAAAAVCREPGADDLLAQLQEHSWITGQEEGDGMRFRMLKTLQEFAERQMGAEERAELSRRHADYYGRLYEGAKRHLDGPGQQAMVARTAADWDNLSAAVRWYLEDDAGPERVLRLTSDLCRFCEVRGIPGEGRSLLEAALAKPGTAPAAVRGPALNGAGWLALMQGDPGAALPRFEGALAAAREAANRRDETIALGNLGLVAEAAGRYDEAASYFGRSGDLAREVGAGLFEANARGNLANLLKSRGRYEEACAQYRECVGLFEAMGNHRSEAIVWINMGDAFGKAGKFVDGLGALRHGLGISHRLGDRWLLAASFEGLAGILVGAGRVREAVRLLGAAGRFRSEMGIPAAPADREAFERSAGVWRQELGEAAFASSWREGEQAALEQAVGWASEGTA